jgi:hypothetical protein
MKTLGLLAMISITYAGSVFAGQLVQGNYVFCQKGKDATAAVGMLNYKLGANTQVYVDSIPFSFINIGHVSAPTIIKEGNDTLACVTLSSK